jgi:NitT/TauT family transport system ATP-binding protein
MTREQFYSDLQRISQEHRKTILLVTHNVREAVCLGDRCLSVFTRPGHIQEEYKILLKRPRDINSVELAEYATRITRTLKRMLHGTTELL